MSALRRQQGFSLIEMMMAMALTLVVFGATLSVLDAYTNDSQGNIKRNDAQDLARLSVDRIVRQLRNIASPLTSPKLLERSTPYDLVFQTIGTPSGANSAGTERVRYCIPADTTPGSSNLEALYSETQTWSTSSAPASPWPSDPSVTIPCPDNSPSATTTRVAYAITNRYKGADRAAFTYNNGTAPSDLSKIFTVQIDLFVNPTPTLKTCAQPSPPPSSCTESQLRSAAFLRNQPRAPVANISFTPTGGGGVLLNGGTSYSPDGQDLSYSWSCTSPSPCPQAAALSDSGNGLVDWQPGAGTYTVSLTVTDQAGLIGTTTQQVTVT